MFQRLVPSNNNIILRRQLLCLSYLPSHNLRLYNKAITWDTEYVQRGLDKEKRIVDELFYRNDMNSSDMEKVRSMVSSAVSREFPNHRGDIKRGVERKILKTIQQKSQEKKKEL